MVNCVGGGSVMKCLVEVEVGRCLFNPILKQQVTVLEHV